MSRGAKRSAKRRRSTEDAIRLHRVAQRAVWRLNVLEWLILGGAMALAMVGGAAVAWLIAPAIGAGFRPTWALTSLVLFVVPGVIALTRARMAERKPGPTSREHDEHNG